MKYLKVYQATRKGYALCPQGGIFDRSYPTSKLRRARVQFHDGICVSPALTTHSANALAVFIDAIDYEATTRTQASD